MSRRARRRGERWGKGPWTLRTRLVVSAVTLIAVVAAVIGSVTTIAFHSYMYDKLDKQLFSIAMRATKPPPGGGAAGAGGQPMPADGPDDDPLAFIDARGQPFGTIGAVSVDGSITVSSVVEESSAALEQTAAASERPLKGAEEKALEAADIQVGDGARSVDLPGLGAYRVTAVEERTGRRPSSSASPPPRCAAPSPP